MKKEKLNFLKPERVNNLGQWLVEQGISAGFPSPADDFKEVRISLDKELVKNTESTFYARVCGNSMEDAEISDGDLLVIDRSIEPKNNMISICFLDGEFTVKRILKKEGTAVGLADGTLEVGGKIIYTAVNLKVGLFKN